MTVLELVHQVARAAGVAITAAHAEHIIWAETGYPCFWPNRDKSPEENFRMQVREYFDRIRPVKKGRGQRRSRRNR